jgi:hypothetical protein
MILTYDQYVTHNQLTESKRQLMINIFNQFEDIKPIINEAMAFVDEGVFDVDFDLILEGQELNEENLMQRMKDKFDQAVKVAKERGKEALSASQEKIMAFGGNIGAVIKMIVSKLGEWIKKSFDVAKATWGKAFQQVAPDMLTAIGKKSEEKVHDLSDEVKKLGQVTKSLGGWIFSGFTKQVQGAGLEASKEEIKESFELAIYEMLNEAITSGELDFTDLLNEADSEKAQIPFLSALSKKLGHFPPFSLLHDVQHGLEKVTNTALAKMSYYATELAGAPGPYTFGAISALTGIAGEVIVKGQAKHAILHFVPGLGTILALISNVAMAMAFIAIVEVLITKSKSNDQTA